MSPFPSSFKSYTFSEVQVSLNFLWDRLSLLQRIKHCLASCTANFTCLLVLPMVTHFWVKLCILYRHGDLDFQRAYEFQISYPIFPANTFTFIRLCIPIRSLENMGIILISVQEFWFSVSLYELKCLPKDSKYVLSCMLILLLFMNSLP